MTMENENTKNYPFGRKAAEGHAPRTVHDANHVAGFDPPPPLRADAPMSMRPHDAGPRQPVHITPSSARPRNDMGPGLLPARGCLDAAPHPYSPAAQKQ